MIFKVFSRCVKCYLKLKENNIIFVGAIWNPAPMPKVDAGEPAISWVFDRGYVTWAGITPDDTITRNREREEIQELAKTDLLAYIKAMKEWGIGREKRFIGEGWFNKRF